jgi:hypothetical protein
MTLDDINDLQINTIIYYIYNCLTITFKLDTIEIDIVIKRACCNAVFTYSIFKAMKGITIM